MFVTIELISDLLCYSENKSFVTILFNFRQKHFSRCWGSNLGKSPIESAFEAVAYVIQPPFAAMPLTLPRVMQFKMVL